jgi:hypothetical protein
MWYFKGKENSTAQYFDAILINISTHNYTSFISQQIRTKQYVSSVKQILE